MKRVHHIEPSEALRLAGRIFDLEKTFPSNILLERYDDVLFFACNNGFWTAFNPVWNLLQTSDRVLKDQTLYLASLDDVRHPAIGQPQKGSYRIDFPLSYGSFTDSIKNGEAIYAPHYLELVLFNASGELVVYCNEDFSIFLVTGSNRELIRHLSRNPESSSALGDAYLGSSLPELQTSLPPKLGYSDEDVLRFSEWFGSWV